jgi:hypothetical protein
MNPKELWNKLWNKLSFPMKIYATGVTMVAIGVSHSLADLFLFCGIGFILGAAFIAMAP